MSYNPLVKLQSLTGVPYVVLYELDLTKVVPRHEPGSPGFVVYFAPDTTDLHSVHDQAVPYPTRTGVFRKHRLAGQEYDPIPTEMQGLERISDGPPPQPTLRMANVTRYFGDYLQKYGDMVGARVTRTVITDNYMDHEDPAQPGTWIPGEPGNAFRRETFVLQQKVSQTPLWLEYRCVSDVEYLAGTFPARVMLRETCPLRYPLYDPGAPGFYTARATCPWRPDLTGAYFDLNDQSTADPAEDACSKTVQGCKVRFTEPTTTPSEPLPIGAFPGLGQPG